MMPPSEWELAKLRRENMIREAEVHNLAQAMRRRNKPSRYASVMTNVGAKMVAIGQSLQERYGDFGEEPYHA